MTIFFSLAGIFSILSFSEVLWQRKVIRGEMGRKFVHILIGTFVAFWPWLMSWRWIQIISLLFMIAILLSEHFHIFHAIHDVRRKTYGELLYGAGVFVAATFTHINWLFAVAILSVALADGLAAIFGTYFGRDTRFHFWGSEKSLVGCVVFFVTIVSVILFMASMHVYGAEHDLLLKLSIPIGLFLTGVEIVSVKGSDNITLPLFSILVTHYLLSALA